MSYIPDVSTGETNPWVDRYEIDLTAQSSQNMKSGGDGNYTIDGKTWTVTNTANASTFEIGANGIYIVPTAGVISEASYTGPRIHVDLDALYSSLAPDQAVRVLLYAVFTGTMQGDYEAMAHGLIKNDFTGDQYGIWNGYGGARVIGMRPGTYMEGLAETDAYLTGTAWDVFSMILDGDKMQHGIGQWSSGFPSDSNIRIVGATHSNAASGAYVDLASLAFFFGAEYNLVSGPLGLTGIQLKHLKLQTRTPARGIALTNR